MLDSDIIIWLLRGNREILAAFDAAVREEKGNVCISPVQLAEIRAGMRDNERVQVERMLATFRIIPIEEKAGVVAGEYLRQYAKTHSVTLADAFVAATDLMPSPKMKRMITRKKKSKNNPHPIAIT